MKNEASLYLPVIKISLLGNPWVSIGTMGHFKLLPVMAFQKITNLVLIVLNTSIYVISDYITVLLFVHMMSNSF
jgi:hypothetical protein